MPLVNQTRTSAHRVAIMDWFAARTGLGAAKVMWLNQPTPRKALPAGTLQLLSRGKKIGEDYVQQILNGGVIERHYLGVRGLVIQA